MDDHIARLQEIFEKVDILLEMVEAISNQLQLLMHDKEGPTNHKKRGRHNHR